MKAKDEDEQSFRRGSRSRDSTVRRPDVLGDETRGEVFEGEAKDAWLMGKLETVYTLNRHVEDIRDRLVVDADR